MMAVSDLKLRNYDVNRLIDPKLRAMFNICHFSWGTRDLEIGLMDYSWLQMVAGTLKFKN